VNTLRSCAALLMASLACASVPPAVKPLVKSEIPPNRAGTIFDEALRELVSRGFIAVPDRAAGVIDCKPVMRIARCALSTCRVRDIVRVVVSRQGVLTVSIDRQMAVLNAGDSRDNFYPPNPGEAAELEREERALLAAILQRTGG
jgi:hypothetical protein